MKKVCINIPDNFYLVLKTYCKRKGLTVSDLVRTCVYKRIGIQTRLAHMKPGKRGAD